MNIRRFFLSICLSTALLTPSQAQNWQDPNTNSVNRAPMHTSYFSYESQDLALHGVREASSRFMSLNGLWKFAWAEHANLRHTDFYKADYNDLSWDRMPVPGLWELNGYGDPVYVNVGWAWANQYHSNPPIVPQENNHVGSYRHSFTLPEDWDGKNIFIHFGSVTSNLHLWINGQEVGYSEDSKLEAEFDITPYVKKGENLIAAQIFRWCDGTYVEDQDFWRLTGIARGVFLYAREKAHIQDFTLNPTLDNAYKNGKLEIFASLNQEQQGYQILARLMDPKGNLVAEKPLEASGNSFHGLFNISKAALWSAEIPNLYKLILSLKDTRTGVVSEHIPWNVGFRTVEIKNAQVLINGQPVLFKGADRHEMDPISGYHVTRERMIQDIKIMKELNINAIRTCHYPNTPLWYDLCDQYGIYIVDEANVESHGMGYGEKTLGKNPLYLTTHVERAIRMFQRDKNHACVVTWSLGNEAGDGPNFKASYDALKNADIQKRPVQYERSTDGSISDIFCPMYYNYANCEKYLTNNPKKPLIQCEYAHAMGNSMGGFKEYWDLVRKYPNYQGGFIWDFVDQGLHLYRPQGYYVISYGGDYNKYDISDLNFNCNGLISPDRIPNPHAYEVAYYYQNIWATDSDAANGKIKVLNENFFKDLSNYILHWELMADGTCLRSGNLDNLKVAPQQQALVSLGYTAQDWAQNKDKELFLNVYFVTKNAEGLLPGGQTIAKAQMPLWTPRPEERNEPLADGTCTIKENDRQYLMIDAGNLFVEFSKRNGFISRLEYNGKNMLLEGSFLKPNFWRAPTDNDFGANLQMRYRLWKEPQMKLEKLETAQDKGNTIVTASFQMEQLKSTLQLTYIIAYNQGITITQEIKTLATGEEAKQMPNLFRFGMRWQSPKSYDRLEYYGRGPIENYSDRKSNAFVGLYTQTVDEQFYPYVRPQETGTKSDLRWWALTNAASTGWRVTSPKLFSASALPYSIEQLDEGTFKHNTHPQDILKGNFTECCVDAYQMGLGCITSWGTLPLPEYMLPYADYSFTFTINPQFLK